MKSMNIKIPLNLATRMDEDGTLNPMFLSNFLLDNLDNEIDEEPCKGLSFNYTFKVDKNLHKAVKMVALNHDLAMNEFVCRLLVRYYRGV